ncbi:unnamed protein product [Phyllotreta striolata]|uniref:Uncharacterized protein n=1 Tax=Phyllotreta striolata TaxID=444603 RepID=A0A9N9TPT8_PHYSR|nr:unnamed protein product [Phyllotreta striolata]
MSIEAELKTAKDTSRKSENLRKMTLIQLKEVSAREEALLKNKSLLSKLPDKGAAIKTFYNKVLEEIRAKEDLAAVEMSLQNLNISDSDKHTQKICGIEASPAKERYKPWYTLNSTKDIHTDRKVFRAMEDWSKCNKPTKLIPLSESLDLLKEQEEKVKQEQFKVKRRHLFELNDESDDSGSSTGEEIDEIDE